MLIGAHVSPAGGPANAVARGLERAAGRSRSSTRARAPGGRRVYSDEEVAAFNEAIGRLGHRRARDPRRLPAQLRLRGHGDPRQVARPSLVASLRAGAALARSAWSCIPGSALKAGPSTRRSSARRHDHGGAEGVRDCALHLENTAGAGGTLGRTFEELATLIDGAGGGSGSAPAWTRATCWPAATTSAPPRG